MAITVRITGLLVPVGASGPIGIWACRSAVMVRVLALEGLVGPNVAGRYEVAL